MHARRATLPRLIVTAFLSAVAVRGAPTTSGRILAKLKETSAAATASESAALAQAGVAVTHRFSLVPGLLELETSATATTSAGGQSTKTLSSGERIAALRATGLFEYVEPDFPRHLHAVPTDEAFADGRHWNLDNYGQDDGVAGMDVDAVAAWDITTGSTDVIVAVIDTGIRVTHQDLAAQMWVNPGEIADNGLDDDGNGYIDDVHGIDAITGSGDPDDDYGHGTLVAGIIGAAANNDGAAVGVCWQVRLMACRFISAETGEGLDADAIRCMEYAVANGARVINASWGGASLTQALQDAIEGAGDQGVLFVASAGNGVPGYSVDLLPNYPAALPLDNIISVAGMRRAGEIDWYSCYGAGSVDIGAPTSGVFSTAYGSDTAYGTIGGTSAAAPHVSAVAALLLAQDATLTVAQLRDRLIASAVETESLVDKTRTGGRVSAYRALTAAPDGELEIIVSCNTGRALFTSQASTIEAQVGDVDPVTGATVTGTVDGTSLSFADDGLAPDRTAGDGIYTAAFTTPDSTGTGTLAFVIDASAPGYTAAHAELAREIYEGADNDDFADRTSLTEQCDGEYCEASVDNTSASREEGEPVPASDTGATGGRSLWWTWTAPRDGRVDITIEGEQYGRIFDSVLGVYTGDALASLVEIASNDDLDPDGPSVYPWWMLEEASRVVFDAIAGTEYQIVVDGFGGDAGTGDLVLAMAPINDDFEDRTVLTGASVSAAGRLSGASTEEDEPRACRGNTVWWSWTAPADGLVAIDIGNNDSLIYGFDDIHVYTGDSFAALEAVADNSGDEVNGGDGVVRFLARVGERYEISVDSWNMESGPLYSVGTFTLDIAQTPLAATAETSTVQAGTETVLSIDLEGIEDVTYQWYCDGVAIDGATAATLTLSSTQRFQAGSYTVVVTYAGGSIESEAVELTVETPADSGARVTNLSTRALCRTGDEVLIPGFVIQGSETQRLLLRAVGPELAAFGVANVLPDPTLVLKRYEDTRYVDYASNDNWCDNTNWKEIRSAAANVYAFSLEEGSLSAALLVDLPAGTYTLVGSDAGGETGIGMIELYEVDTDAHANTDAEAEAEAHLVNISNRGHVGTGAEIMIPGFVVSDEGSKTFLLRAVGPGLAAHGVEGVLADPQMAVYRRDSTTGVETRILSNDNWGENGDAGDVAAAAAQVYAFALDEGSADAAFVVTLAPGIYTVHASGVGATTGIALVELYVVP